MTDKNEVPDFASLSEEEMEEILRKESVAAEPSDVVEEQPKQPRDDKGRFAKTEETVDTEPDTPAGDVKQQLFPEEVVYEIDLGDGAGLQKFKGKDWQEVATKLGKAQEHASRKIREQAEQLRRVEEERRQREQEDKALSEDEEFVLSQELMSRPSEAVKKIFKQMTGMDITEFKTVAERAKAFEAAQAQQTDAQKRTEAGNAFIEAHPEYINSGAVGERNNARFAKVIGLLVTEAQNQGREIDYAAILEQAYSDLTTDGLLVLRDGDNVTAEPQPAGSAQRRIGVAEEEVQVQRRKASNLPSRSRIVNVPSRADQSEQQFNTLSLEEQEALLRRNNLH